MPPVIVGVAAGVAAAGVVSTAAAIAIGVAATALTYAVTPEFGAGSFSNEAYAQQQMLRSPAEPRRGVYGRAMVSGPLIFAEETGTDNEFLHLVIALAGHRCDAIETVYFGDEVAWTVSGGIKSKFASHARIKPHLGDQTAADSQLLSDCSAWTSKHVGHGVTYLYVRLKYDVDVFPNGVPNIKALVRGKPVYDPRLDSSNGGSGTHRFNDPNTWQWTDNWALCVLDYTRFESGVGATETEIDLPTYALAAHDSDEFVEYQTDEWERRYSCNGTYTQDASPASILEKMLTAGAGMQVYVGGKYQLYAGVYQGPEVLTLTEDDCAGDVDISPYTSRSELCNAVRGTFVDPDSFYQPTDFTPYESAYYRGQDNGEYIDHDIDLPFTQSSWTAQRLAKLHLELNRAGMQITFPTKMIGLAVSVGKVIRLQLPSLGINQTFMVADWQFDFGRPVKLILRETNADIFEFDKGSYTQRDLAPNTTLPDPSKVPTVSGVVWIPSGDDANWQGELSWNAPGSNSAYRYRLEVVNQQQEVVYQASIEGTRHHVPKLDAGTYNLYLWAVNLFSNRSNIPASMTIGADAPPPVNGVLADIGALSLTLRPQTAAVIAATTEFEVKGSLNTVLNNADYLGQGKEVLWPNRHPNTFYYVWARSVNNYGFGAWFGPVGIQTSTDNSAIVELIGTAFDKFTWFAWADDNAGSGFTTVEAQGEGKDYLGVATEKKTSAPSGNWQDYTWTKIKTEIPDVFTPEEQTQLDNLMAGKLPAGDKDMLAAQDALNNPALANDLLTSLALLNNGIDAASLNGETPGGAQNKADAAKSAAEAYALAKANLAETTAKAYADGVVTAEENRAILDAQAKADSAKAQAIAAAASDAQTKADAAKTQAINVAASDAQYKADSAFNRAIELSVTREYFDFYLHYKSAVILLVPYAENGTNWSESEIFGQLTFRRGGVNSSNRTERLDLSVKSAYSTTDLSMTKLEISWNWQFCTCNYNGKKWLAIHSGTNVQDARVEFWGRRTMANIAGYSASDQFKVIDYYRTGEPGYGTGAINSEIYNSIVNIAGNSARNFNGTPLENINDSQAKASAAENNAISSVALGNFIANIGLISTLIADTGLFNHLKSRLGVFGGLTAETIASLAIATNHLQAGAVTADKVTVNTALIQKLIADQGLFNQLQAQLGIFGGLSANSIAAGAIQSDKLAVLAREYVNPVSITRNLVGWGGVLEDGSGGNGSVVEYDNTEKALVIKSSSNHSVWCKSWKVNHDKIYRISMKIKASAASGLYYLGVSALTYSREGGISNGGNGQGDIALHNYSTLRAYAGSSANSYFSSGGSGTEYVEHIVYLIGANRSVSDCPAHDGPAGSPFLKLDINATDASIRILNWSNTSYKKLYIKDVSVIEAGAGQIVAENIVANAITADKIAVNAVSAGKIAANTVTATELLADSALINKLVATSALFNSLQARLAVFGGLTANSISSDAILGRHIKAGETIESPVIIGGQYQLIGSNTMKIESETPFGPDGLIEWRGPKLILNGQPNWSQIRKSNATRWTDSTGNEYFGGSLSAGVLKTGVTNPDKNAYTANSFPVVIGPFGSGGKAKTVVVSFDFDASWTATTAANGATPALSWQLQRKIGSGSWATVSNGTFSGSINSTYEAEIGRYLVNEFCSGSSTFTDTSTSTSDFSYQLKVISQTRYSATSNVNNQKLTVISTEQ